MRPYTHDHMPAQETWLDCATADGGRLRVVLLAADQQAAAPLLARARSIAQALATHRDAALQFLWQAGRDTGDPEDPPVTFLEHFTPSDLIVAADGGYVLHLAPRDATWFMDGYWPAVRFAADDRPADWICES
ncbi:hypothetical protein IB268_05410 [Achromobacter sp. ACM01]|jgi:hypothetical protein|uniref:hypothetical protein n=1 Tax=Achromobacter sp. ACM01 TaxID=2769298 RepID=UPI00177F1556|nr:hypothetical protein [Achromobacter sp. ACM01]MBD9472332.1 hypothetical protein [Achromobacter sp. ACM01]